jgi:hypothetical protein
MRTEVVSKLRPLKLPYGIRGGKLVHVSEVVAGKACDCISPLDEITPLIARKGAINRAHFAAESLCDPVAACETVFHRLAKEVLAEVRRLALPALELELVNRTVTVASERVVENLAVATEERVGGSRFSADNVVTVETSVGQRKLLVEWVVTHPCEPEKLEFLRAQRVACLEIEIGSKSLPLAQAREWILINAPRKWIWHPRFEWSALRNYGLKLTRRPAFRAVRFFKTRFGTKPVEASWVKGCPMHEKIVSTRRCRRCHCAYGFDYLQDAYIDCAAESARSMAQVLKARAREPGEPSDGLWYESAKPNLGSGFRLGWDNRRSVLLPEVAAELKRGPYASPPRLNAVVEEPSNTSSQTDI